MFKVLFVCTGNICRSPTAHGVLRHRLKELALDTRVFADSAAMKSYHIGDPPDFRSMDRAAARGYDLSDLRARRIETDDFHDFSLILAMDKGHFRGLKAVRPKESRADIRLFMDFAPQLNIKQVPDPYYGGQDDFEHVLDLVEAGVDGLINTLKQEYLYLDDSR